MVDRSVRRVALLAIHPEHAAAILAGRKKVEFRKRMLDPSIEHVLLYATSPLQSVVGYFRIDSIDQGSPTAIWNKHGNWGGIPRRIFREYYAGSSTAVAILVASATAFEYPVPLEKLSAVAPPQSFTYLPVRTVDVLRSTMSVAGPATRPASRTAS